MTLIITALLCFSRIYDIHPHASPGIPDALSLALSRVISRAQVNACLIDELVGATAEHEHAASLHCSRNIVRAHHPRCCRCLYLVQAACARHDS